MMRRMRKNGGEDPSEVQEYEALIEIMNIGIWLYENGHFTDLNLLIHQF